MERWAKIDGYDNYLISSTGMVKSLSRIKKWKHHGKSGTYISRERILKPIMLHGSGKTNYFQYNLSQDGMYKVFLAHRLVATAFIPNQKNKPQVNHKDGNGLNNNVDNLEWVTGSENSLHASRVLGRQAWCKGIYGETAPTSRPVLQLDLEGNLVKRWGCGLDAVREGGFDSSGITRACNGENKTHKGFIWKYEKPKNYRSK